MNVLKLSQISDFLTKTVLFGLCFSFSAIAGVVEPPANEDPFVALEFRCKKATECRLLTPDDFLRENIVKVNKGTSYNDNDNNQQTAEKSGYYVGMINEFVNVEKVGPTGDGNYYVCDEGNEVVVEDGIDSGLGIDDIFSPEEADEVRAQLGFCPTFWAPEQDLGSFPNAPPVEDELPPILPGDGGSAGGSIAPVGPSPGPRRAPRNPFITGGGVGVFLPPIFVVDGGGNNDDGGGVTILPPGTTFCDLNPSDPLCDGSVVNPPGTPSCDLNPLSPGCEEEETPLCEQNPSDPACGDVTLEPVPGPGSIISLGTGIIILKKFFTKGK